MSNNRQTIDERAVRTRNNIAAAVIRLGPQIGVDRITVGALAAEAGISRSTFYSHFGSFEAYLAQSFANMVERMAAHSAIEDGEAGQPILCTRHILAHVYGAPNYVAAISRSRHRPAMLTAAEKRLTVGLDTRLRRCRPELSSARRAILARFVAAGFLGMLRDWMENGMKRPPEQFRREFEAMIGGL